MRPVEDVGVSIVRPLFFPVTLYLQEITPLADLDLAPQVQPTALVRNSTVNIDGEDGELDSLVFLERVGVNFRIEFLPVPDPWIVAVSIEQSWVGPNVFFFTIDK